MRQEKHDEEPEVLRKKREARRGSAIKQSRDIDNEEDRMEIREKAVVKKDKEEH